MLKSKQSDKMMLDEFKLQLSKKHLTPEAFFRVANKKFKPYITTE